MPKVHPGESHAAQNRLEKLIAMRVQPGADKAAIDRRIWDLFGETWAVLFTDLVGFSQRSARYGIIHFLQTIREAERLLVPVIDDHDGLLLKIEGDSMLVLVRRPHHAIACAIAMQGVLTPYNCGVVEEEQIHLCVGIGYGPILRIGEGEVFGSEVNAASKLGEDRAKGGEILITDSVFSAVKGECDLGFVAVPDVLPGAGVAYRVIYGECLVPRAA